MVSIEEGVSAIGAPVTVSRVRFGGALQGAVRNGLTLLVVPVIALVAWWIAGSVMPGLRGEIIASPLSILKALGEQLTSTESWHDVGVSMLSFGIAFGIALPSAVVLGMALASSRRLTELLEPFVYAIYSIPKVALYPVFLIVFGLTLKTIIGLGVLQGFYPAFFATLGGLKAVNPIHLEVARSLQASGFQVFRKVIFRAGLRPIISGSRVSALMCFHGVITGEIISGDSGLGHQVIRHYQNFMYPDMYASIIVAAAAVLVVYQLTSVIERKLVRVVGGR
jgi:NitT/TauT family transport system permease protein